MKKKTDIWYMCVLQWVEANEALFTFRHNLLEKLVTKLMYFIPSKKGQNWVVKQV